VHDDPAELVRALNDAVRVHSPSPRFSTVVFGFLDIGDEVGVRIAVAGHPLPLLATADGAVEVLGTPGTLLGVFPEVEVVTDRRPLAPGDTLVLYTDGVVESRREGVAFGEPRLRRLLESVAGGDAAAVADCIPDAIAEYQDDPSDDLAVLVVQRRPAPPG
jgi:serine phosphatase RsbU (regulator of sigma subunit)